MYYGDVEVVGTCSICGGDVVTPKMLLMVGPWPAPYCIRCGATVKRNLPVIPMEPNPPWRRTTGPIWICQNNDGGPRCSVSWGYWK